MINPLVQIQASATKLSVKSAVNPALWYSATISPICFISAFAFRNHHEICLILILAGLISLTLPLIAYIYFMLKDPDKLQSEDFQLHKMDKIAGKYIGVIPNSEFIPSIMLPEVEKTSMIKEHVIDDNKQ